VNATTGSNGADWPLAAAARERWYGSNIAFHS